MKILGTVIERKASRGGVNIVIQPDLGTTTFMGGIPRDNIELAGLSDEAAKGYGQGMSVCLDVSVLERISIEEVGEDIDSGENESPME